MSKKTMLISGQCVFVLSSEELAHPPRLYCSRCLLKCLHITPNLPFLLYSPHVAWSYIKLSSGRKEHDCTCNHSSELECLVLLLQFAAMGEWNVGPAIHSSLQYVWPHCGLDAVLGAEDAETRCKACSRFMIKGRRDNHDKRPVGGGTNVWWCTKGTWNRAQGCFTY